MSLKPDFRLQSDTLCGGLIFSLGLLSSFVIETVQVEILCCIYGLQGLALSLCNRQILSSAGCVLSFHRNDIRFCWKASVYDPPDRQNMLKSRSQVPLLNC